MKGRSRYAILIPMELSERIEKESWVGKQIEVIIIEPDS